jgi:hypothetical protein
MRNFLQDVPEKHEPSSDQFSAAQNSAKLVNLL